MPDNIVSIYNSGTYEYPQKDNCFRPDSLFPETPFSEISNDSNLVYPAVREALFQMGYDKENFGTKDWNPLKEFIKPNDTVLIKPNLVMDVNPLGNTDCLYTQPSVVAPVIDYIIIALGGTGKIIVGDAPMQECNFQNLAHESGYSRLIDFYRSKNIDIELVDFRELTTVVENGIYHQKINEKSTGTVVNLGKSSEFYGSSKKEERKFRITNYDPRILPTHHKGEIQEYYVSDYVLNANVIINMPKPKSHRKAGATVSLKNMVGINTRKEFLPHHTLGAVKDGGDEYLRKSIIHRARSFVWDRRNIAQFEKRYSIARLYGFVNKILSKALYICGNDISEGSWYGNHTISRTITDLNKIVVYADKSGHICNTPQRKMLIVADMIIAGEKEGPVRPSPKNVGIVAVGDNPLQFDKIITTLMGFDYRKIPTIQQVSTVDNLVTGGYNDYVIVSNDSRFDRKTIKTIDLKDSFGFEPTSGWKNHIELR